MGVVVVVVLAFKARVLANYSFCDEPGNYKRLNDLRRMGQLTKKEKYSYYIQKSAVT